MQFSADAHPYHYDGDFLDRCWPFLLFAATANCLLFPSHFFSPCAVRCCPPRREPQRNYNLISLRGTMWAHNGPLCSISLISGFNLVFFVALLCNQVFELFFCFRDILLRVMTARLNLRLLSFRARNRDEALRCYVTKHCQSSDCNYSQQLFELLI